MYIYDSTLYTSVSNEQVDTQIHRKEHLGEVIFEMSSEGSVVPHGCTPGVNPKGGHTQWVWMADEETGENCRAKVLCRNSRISES